MRQGDLDGHLSLPQTVFVVVPGLLPSMSGEGTGKGVTGLDMVCFLRRHVAYPFSRALVVAWKLLTTDIVGVSSKTYLCIEAPPKVSTVWGPRKISSAKKKVTDRATDTCQ